MPKFTPDSIFLAYQTNSHFAMKSLFSLALILHCAAPTQAASTFLYPPAEGVNVVQGSKVTLNWTTDWGAVYVSLVAYQGNGAGGWVSKIFLGMRRSKKGE